MRPRWPAEILDSLKNPFRLDEHEVFATGSVGISLYPNDGETVEALLKNADAAMYHAKDSGRGNYQFYDESMNAKAMLRLSMENKLRKALERQELLLHYQPQLDMDTGRIIGVEALVRWMNPDLGLVPPGSFIPLAEETGLILSIGEWVLRTACAQIREWQMKGHDSLRMAVNLSGAAVPAARDPSDRPGHGAGGGPGSTVPGAGDHRDDPAPGHRGERPDSPELKALGVRISLDDFGTGYRSSAILKRFPIDILKIDRSFIRDIATDPDDGAITSAIIAMAKGLGIAPMAEGVETPGAAQRSSTAGAAA